MIPGARVHGRTIASTVAKIVHAIGKAFEPDFCSCCDPSINPIATPYCVCCFKAIRWLI